MEEKENDLNEVLDEKIENAEAENVEETVVSDSENTMETEEVIEEKVLTDEELYAKIQTEKLLKKQKVKKISTISVMSVVLALVIVVVCLASIPLNLKPYFFNNEYIAYVYIDDYSNSTTGMMSSTTNEKEYNNLRSLIDSMFNQTYFSALFNGSVFSYNITESDRMTYSTFRSALTNGSYGDYIRLEFIEEQILLNKDGSRYSSTRYPSLVTYFTFTEAYMLISDEEGDTDCTIYFVVQYINRNENSSSYGEVVSGSSDTYVIKMTTFAETYQIYEHFASEE